MLWSYWLQVFLFLNRDVLFGGGYEVEDKHKGYGETVHQQAVSLIIFNLKLRPKLKSSSTEVRSDWGPIWIRLFEFIFLNPSRLWVSLHSDWLQFSEPMKSSVINLLFRLFVKYCQSSWTVFHVLCFFIPGSGVFTWPPRDLKPPLFNTWALRSFGLSLFYTGS